MNKDNPVSLLRRFVDETINDLGTKSDWSWAPAEKVEKDELESLSPSSEYNED